METSSGYYKQIQDLLEGCWGFTYEYRMGIPAVGNELEAEELLGVS